jgi:hypothetical protein
MTGDYAVITPHPVKYDEGQTRLLADEGQVGKIEVVKIEDLHRDMSYQRPINQELVDEIASKWDIAAAGPIVVSRRKNGDLYIVNGQHRTAAATQVGETEILAQVIDGLTPKEEAILRLKGNIRRTDKPQERFQAQLTAGDPESIAIKQIVEAIGGTVNTSANAVYGINCISTLEGLYRRDNGVLLTRTLEAVREIFGSLDGINVTVSVLKGMSWFLEAHRAGYDRGRLHEKLQQLGTTRMLQQARNHKAVMGGAMWINTYRAMVEAYNERLSDSKKLEVRTGKTAAYGRATGGSGEGW